MAVKSGLSKPAGAGGVLSGIKGSDTRQHPLHTVPDRRVKPQPYVPLGKPGKR